MLKRMLGLLAAVLMIAALVGVPGEAQAKKPSQALRQVNDEEERLLKGFDKELGQGKAQPHEWEERVESLTQFAARRAEGFKTADWQGDEALALGTLYQRAEMYSEAAEAYRVFLRGESRGRQADAARGSLIRSLIEVEQLDEAEKALDAWAEGAREGAMMKVTRVGLHLDLALRLRDRGRLDRAAYRAREGYNMADAIEFAGPVASLQEPTQRDQMALAALAIACFERAGKAKEADSLRAIVEKYDFGRQPALKTLFEGALVAERLIGKPAPDLAATRWLDSPALKMRELRGKVVLLDFWAMWCGPCIAGYPHLRGFQAKYESRGFQVIGVTRFFGRSDVEENLGREQELKSLQAYKVKYKQLWPVAVGKIDDPANDEAFGVTALPTAVLIDREGRVRNLFRGTGLHRKLEARIKQLLDEKPQ